jgi:hypothetical protein
MGYFSLFKLSIENFKFKRGKEKHASKREREGEGVNGLSQGIKYFARIA